MSHHFKWIGRSRTAHETRYVNFGRGAKKKLDIRKPFAFPFRFGARRAKPHPDLLHTQADEHLWLLRPGGGDVAVHLADGRAHISLGVPRPPESVAIIKASHFLDLLARRSDASVAQATGRLKVEGEASAAFVVGGMVAQFQKQKESARGVAGKALSLYSN